MGAKESDFAETVAEATQLLANRFGGAPELSQPEDLGGSGSALVLRCRVAPNPFLQERSVVIKRLPRSPGEQGSAPASGVENTDFIALVREVVAYQYTNALGHSARPGPVLLAYDVTRRLFILSDAGDGDTFTDILTLKGQADRLGAVRKLGRALGRMHSATFAGETSYDTLLRRQCHKHDIPVAAIRDSDIDVAQLIRQGIGLLGDSQGDVDSTVLQFAEAAAARQSRPELKAFTPFDITPDNILLTSSVVFLDYEWAGFRDVAMDVACIIAGFPNDNSTSALTDDEVSEFLAAWKAEIHGVWPQVRDTGFFNYWVLTAIIGWAFVSLTMLYYGRLVVERDTMGDLQDPAQAQPLIELSERQLQDIATTVDALQRYAARSSQPGFAEVEDFARRLLKVLARHGARPVRPVIH